LSTALQCTITGTITVRTDQRLAPGPFTAPFTQVVEFSEDRRQAILTGLSFAFGPGITIKQSAGGVGTFDPATGAVSIPITLVIHVPQIPFNSNATIDFAAPGLTTEAQLPAGPFTGQGSRLDRATGNIVLVATGIAIDNAFLRGSHVEVRATGTLAPLP
jgi:hypothetical protein